MPKVVDRSPGVLQFFCPACSRPHTVDVNEEGWAWNGNRESPSLRPSVKVTYDGEDAGIDGAPFAVCHSFVTTGEIVYCDDSTHGAAGKALKLPDFPADPYGER